MICTREQSGQKTRSRGAVTSGDPSWSAESRASAKGVVPKERIGNASSLFNLIANKGTDPDMAPQFAQGTGAAVTVAANFGADGRQRAAVVLNKFEDMNYAEIAEVMGLTTKAVKSLLSRARTNLRAALSGYIYMDGQPPPETEEKDEG